MPRKVKQLDDNDVPLKIEHIGLHLWRANQQWQIQFECEMIAAGHAWFKEARAALIPHIDRNGTCQSDLTALVGLSKQAVQQQLDGLVADGVIERRPDSGDARVRRIYFTAHGMRVLDDANAVKRRIEREYERLLGTEEFSRLCTVLVELLDHDRAHDKIPSTKARTKQ
jgi:DNA-binding MarR family transcriptional regulator